MSEARSAFKLRSTSIIGEAVLIVALVLAAFVYVSLLSYDKGADAQTVNLGGRLGLSIAHGLLATFGLSAYLLIAALAYGCWSFTRMMKDDSFSWQLLASSVIGLVLLTISTCGLEALRVFSDAYALPEHGSGGMVGNGIARPLHGLLGFQGATLILLGLWFSSLSLFAMFSWMDVCDWLGRRSHQLWNLSKPLGVTLWKLLDVRQLADKPADHAAAGARPARVAAKPRAPAKSREPVLADRKGPSAKKAAAAGGRAARKAPAAAGDAGGTADSAPPPMDLLATAAAAVTTMSDDELHQLALTIEAKLKEFGVQANVVEILPGPVVTLYEIQLATGVKGSQVVNLVRDLSRALSVSSIRVLETIPGKTTMGLEVPNLDRSTVALQEVIDSKEFNASPSKLSLALGKDIAGNPFVADLATMPHLLVAGTTGSGKSVQINSMILSLLYKASPAEVRMILVDPKIVELAPFNGLPHLLAPVISDMKLVPAVLSWCVNEMERRYQLMADMGVRNLAGLNEAIARAGGKDPDGEPLEPQPQIVVVIDELADLLAVVGKKIEQLISRLAQKARAAGIHLILATQRPSVDVITGLIKANIPSRIAFQVSSRIDSRTILDQGGAESLLGKGDMLYLPGGAPVPVRIHGAFVSDDEVHKVTEHIRATGGEVDHVDFAGQAASAAAVGGDLDGGERDPLFEQAVEIIRNSKRVSISLVQRHLRIGYNRAARLVEELERAGMVSAMDSSGNRQLLVDRQADQSS